MGALIDEVLEQLLRDWKIEPVRVYSGLIETSLNAPAFSVSVVNISAAAANSKYSLDQIKAFWDVRTDTAWESMAGAQAKRRPARGAGGTAAGGGEGEDRRVQGPEGRPGIAGEDGAKRSGGPHSIRARPDQVGHHHGRR